MNTALAFTGLFTNIGLFSHLVLIWAGPVGEQVQGLFYGLRSRRPGAHRILEYSDHHRSILWSRWR